MDFPHERLRRAITETSQSSPAHETWGAVSFCKLRYVKRAEEMLYVLVPDTFVLVARCLIMLVLVPVGTQ